MQISKTTARILARLQQDGNWHMITAARVARHDPTLPSHFNKSADYYAGLAWGKYSALETILHEHNQYRGFICNGIKVGEAPTDYELNDYLFQEAVYSAMEAMAA